MNSLERLQNPVLVDVGLVDIDGSRQLCTLAAHITQGDRAGARERALDRKIVILRVGRPQILIENEEVLGTRASAHRWNQRQRSAGGLNREHKILYGQQ